MAIDIDSFLNKYQQDKKDEIVPSEKKNEEKLNLDFQKETEDKILNAKNKLKNDTRFELLEKIYDEVKKFDEDIPSKFIGIENKANLALKEIGDKYSEEFLLKIKQNVSMIHQNITEHIKILDSKLNTEDFASIIKEHETILKLLDIYPKEFLREKLIISREIKKREIVIYKKINEYIKAQRKLHDAKSVPIIRMLRRYVKRLCNAKRIQRWWRGTYPLWHELAYAPPNGIRYQQSFKHFTQLTKSKKN